MSQPTPQQARKAYLAYRGWQALVVQVDKSIEDLRRMQEELREQKLYQHSDPLRLIIKDLEDAAKYVRSDL